MRIREKMFGGNIVLRESRLYFIQKALSMCYIPISVGSCFTRLPSSVLSILSIFLLLLICVVHVCQLWFMHCFSYGQGLGVKLQRRNNFLTRTLLRFTELNRFNLILVFYCLFICHLIQFLVILSFGLEANRFMRLTLPFKALRRSKYSLCRYY